MTASVNFVVLYILMMHKTLESSLPLWNKPFSQLVEEIGIQV